MPVQHSKLILVVIPDCACSAKQKGRRDLDDRIEVRFCRSPFRYMVRNIQNGLPRWHPLLCKLYSLRLFHNAPQLSKCDEEEVQYDWHDSDRFLNGWKDVVEV